MNLTTAIRLYDSLKSFLSICRYISSKMASRRSVTKYRVSGCCLRFFNSTAIKPISLNLAWLTIRTVNSFKRKSCSCSQGNFWSKKATRSIFSLVSLVSTWRMNCWMTESCSTSAAVLLRNYEGLHMQYACSMLESYLELIFSFSLRRHIRSSKSLNLPKNGYSIVFNK